METVSAGLLAFAVIFGGGLAGCAIGMIVPEHHRTAPTERVVQNATRTMSLLSALVLGLLVATAKNKFDTNNSQIEHFAADLMSLNSQLVNFGPGTNDASALLKEYTTAKIADVWQSYDGPKPGPDHLSAFQALERLQIQVLELAPKSEYQRAMAKGAADIVAELVRERWLLKAEESVRLPQPFMWALLAWLSILFLFIGLFAARNALVVITLFVCALSIAGAVALVEDLDTPFDGLIAVPPEPMLAALAQMGAPLNKHDFGD